MIKFCDFNAVESVVVDGVKFHFKRTNVRTKLEIIVALGSLNKDNLLNTFDELKDVLSKVIVYVECGNEVVPFTDAFETLEEFDTIKRLTAEVVRYCSLSEEERKNSDSPPEQRSPVSAESAESNAAPDGAPAGTTPE